MQVILRDKAEAAQDIAMFELAAPDGGTLPPFTAGAHIDVRVAGFVRQYSLCNSPAETHRYRIGVLRDAQSRGGSAAMHALAVGATLEISAPKNHFALASGARHSILLAGGIGVTPLLAMAEQLAADGASFALHYAARAGLAGGQPASRVLRRGAVAAGGRGGRCLPDPARTARRDGGGGRRRNRDRRPAPLRHRLADLVRARGVRDVPDPGAGRRARAPGSIPDGRGTHLGLFPALCVAGQGLAGAGYVGGGVAPVRAHRRLVTRHRRFLLHARRGIGSKTGPNPTDRARDPVQSITSSPKRKVSPSR